MPDYKFKSCIIDGQEQYDITAANCQNQSTEARSIRFPGNLLSFVDIKMSEIAPLLSEISAGLTRLSEDQSTASVDKILRALDALADHHIYFEVFRQEWTDRIGQYRSTSSLQKIWQQGTQHMVEDLVGIQCRVKDIFSQVLDIDSKSSSIPERMIVYAKTESAFQLCPQTVHYELWNDAAFTEVLYPKTMYELISYHLQECVKRRLRFRICKNCG